MKKEYRDAIFMGIVLGVLVAIFFIVGEIHDAQIQAAINAACPQLTTIPLNFS